MAIEVGTGVPVYLSDGDLKPQCPGCCSNNNTHKIGQMNLEDILQDVHQCTTCNRIFAKALEGGIAQLMDEVRNTSNTENVTFSASDDGAIASNLDGSPGDISQMRMDLSNISSRSPVDTYEMENKLDSILSALHALSSSIERIAEQNAELTRDPLIHLRKSITEFNLK